MSDVNCEEDRLVHKNQPVVEPCCFCSITKIALEEKIHHHTPLNQLTNYTKNSVSSIFCYDHTDTWLIDDRACYSYAANYLYYRMEENGKLVLFHSKLRTLPVGTWDTMPAATIKKTRTFKKGCDLK